MNKPNFFVEILPSTQKSDKIWTKRLPHKLAKQPSVLNNVKFKYYKIYYNQSITKYSSRAAPTETYLMLQPSVSRIKSIYFCAFVGKSA